MTIAIVVVRDETIAERGSLEAASAGDWPLRPDRAGAVESLLAVEPRTGRVRGAWVVVGVREVPSDGRARRVRFELGSPSIPERWGKALPESLMWRPGQAWPIKIVPVSTPGLEWVGGERSTPSRTTALGQASFTLVGDVLHVAIPATMEVRLTVVPAA